MSLGNAFESKNARALTAFKGWLTALSIPFTAGRDGADLLVTGKTGAVVPLQIKAADSPAAPRTAVVLEASVITGRKLQAAFDLFTGFVEALGYEGKIPVDRGPIPKQKAHFSDDPELVGFRHTEFRRVSNPTSEQLAKYSSIIKRTCNTFLRRFETICQDNMLGFDDLQTYAQVWICNYIGLHERSADQDTNHDNTKIATAYLNQRFGELLKTMYKKGRNTFAHLDEAHIAQAGTPFEYGFMKGHSGVVGKVPGGGPEPVQTFLISDPFEEQEEDAGYEARHNLLDKKTPASRKSSAQKLLDKALGEMPHDQMVSILSEAVDNNRIDPTARQEAASRLRAHAEQCGICAVIPSEESEDDEAVV